MASELGCHSIRVNLSGEANLEKWKENSINGLTLLCDYASNFNINIIVENHGGNSSIGNELADVIKSVNLENCGTLPDFGNFCVRRKDGSIYNGPCGIEYDKYTGMKDLMPYAKAVSAKSYDFDEFGNETTIDLTKGALGRFAGVPLTRQKDSSSIGRASVSKTEGCEFESRLSCQLSPR